MIERIASTRHTAIVVVIFLAIAAAGSFSAQKTTAPSVPPLLPTYATLILMQLFLVRYVAAGVRRGGGSIVRICGLVSSPRGWVLDFGVAVVGGMTLRLLTETVKLAAGPYADHTSALLPVTVLEKIVWIAVAITAGICEEIVFRGYFLRQFEALTGSRIAALVLQAILFGLSHGYQGWKSVVVTTVYGAGIGVVALIRGNVRAPVIIHAATDLVGGLMRV